VSGFLARWRGKKDPAAAEMEIERNFRKIIGHEDFGMLKAVLDDDWLLSDKSQNLIDKDRIADYIYTKELSRPRSRDLIREWAGGLPLAFYHGRNHPRKRGD